MKAVFADTFYWLALTNPRDSVHARTKERSLKLTSFLYTTSWVLTEVADALSGREDRALFIDLADSIEASPRIEVIGPHLDLWERGLDLYRKRSDKDWSLTDCISFVVMTEHGLTDALTGDKHFTQAGFRALLK